MTKRIKIWLIIAVCFVLFGGVLFAAAMSAHHWDFTKLSTDKYQTSTVDIRDEFSGISINTDTADITFAPSKEGGCRVVCYESTKVRHSVLVEENVLTIKLLDERKWYDHIGIHFTSPKITVYLPETSYNSLLIKADTSDVLMPDNFSFTTSDISSSTGNVKFFASTRDLAKIKTSTGNITVKNISAGALDLCVSTGKISISKVAVTGDIKLSGSTGDTVITDTTCKNLISKGSTGDISFDSVVALGKFSIKRSTGDVKFEKSDANEIFIKTDTGSVKGTLLSNKVFITETDTGEVNVPKTTNGGRCEITTDTGDITLKTQ